LMRKYKGRVNPTLIASIFVNTIKGLGRGVEQVDVVKAVDELLALYADGKITREAIQDVLQVYVEEDGRRGVVEIINEKGLWRMQYSEVLSLVKFMIDNGVKDRNKLMSSVMRSHRGRVDSGDLGRAIDELLGK